MAADHGPPPHRECSVPGVPRAASGEEPQGCGDDDHPQNRVYDQAEHGGYGDDDDRNEDVHEHVVWLPARSIMQPASLQAGHGWVDHMGLEKGQMRMFARCWHVRSFFK